MSKLFPRYVDKSIEEFQILDPSHEVAVQRVKEYLASLADCRRYGFGLTFLGLTGVGKTFLAQMVLKSAEEEGFNIDSIELATQDLHQCIRQSRQETDFVLFDDVGREPEDESDRSNRLVFSMIQFRSKRMLPFLITSSLPLEYMEQRYTEGFVSLLYEATEIVVVGGEDYRRTGSAEGRRFPPHRPGSP
jgi:DNA replication protein DnaC